MSRQQALAVKPRTTVQARTTRVAAPRSTERIRLVRRDGLTVSCGTYNYAGCSNMYLYTLDYLSKPANGRPPMRLATSVPVTAMFCDRFVTTLKLYIKSNFFIFRMYQFRFSLLGQPWGHAGKRTLRYNQAKCILGPWSSNLHPVLLAELSCCITTSAEKVTYTCMHAKRGISSQHLAKRTSCICSTYHCSFEASSLQTYAWYTSANHMLLQSCTFTQIAMNVQVYATSCSCCRWRHAPFQGAGDSPDHCLA